MANVGSRYARAFADVVANSKLDPERTKAQLQEIIQLFESSADLRKVWETPSIPSEQKRALLDALLAKMGGIPSQLRNFIAVLIDHARIMELPHIGRQFGHEVNERLGIADAEIVSARPLSEAERRELEARLISLIGKRVAASYAVDEKLLGGAQVRIGSTIYDGSVRGQFERMRQELSGEQ